MYVCPAQQYAHHQARRMHLPAGGAGRTDKTDSSIIELAAHHMHHKHHERHTVSCHHILIARGATSPHSRKNARARQDTTQLAPHTSRKQVAMGTRHWVRSSNTKKTHRASIFRHRRCNKQQDAATARTPHTHQPAGHVCRAGQQCGCCSWSCWYLSWLLTTHPQTLTPPRHEHGEQHAPWPLPSSPSC